MTNELKARLLMKLDDFDEIIKNSNISKDIHVNNKKMINNFTSLYNEVNKNKIIKREIERSLKEDFIRNNPFLNKIKNGEPIEFTDLLLCLPEDDYAKTNKGYSFFGYDGNHFEFNNNNLEPLMDYYDQYDIETDYINYYNLFQGNDYKKIIKDTIKQNNYVYYDGIYLTEDHIDEYLKNNFKDIFTLEYVEDDYEEEIDNGYEEIDYIFMKENQSLLNIEPIGLYDNITESTKNRFCKDFNLGRSLQNKIEGLLNKSSILDLFNEHDLIVSEEMSKLLDRMIEINISTFNTLLKVEKLLIQKAIEYNSIVNEYISTIEDSEKVKEIKDKLLLFKTKWGYEYNLYSHTNTLYQREYLDVM